MNIQFMTDENGFKTKNGDVRYLPDFSSLIANTSCEEERNAIKEFMSGIADSQNCFDGFAFKIVLSARDKDGKWTLLQFPWYKSYGEEIPKEIMLKHVLEVIQDKDSPYSV